MKLVFIFVLFSTASLALTETPPAAFLYACNDETVTFPWRGSNKKDTALDIKWFHHLSNGVEEMVAFYTDKQFLAVEQRLSHLADHRLTFSNVTVNDSGLYSVQITEDEADEFRFTFNLQVSDSPMVKDQELEVTQDSVALWNETAKQWTITLFCGTFTFKGDDAPIQVDWILPNGETQASNGYEKGRFNLTITPVTADMKYICRIPPRFYPNICLTDDNTGNKTENPDLTEASLFVEEVKTRLIVNEAEQKRLNEVVANLSSAFRAHELCWESYNYKTINDIAGLRNLGSSSEGTLCDQNITAGWYRWFLNGQEATIPTSCTPTKKCGTHATMWIDLKGQPLPAVGGDVQGRVCAHNESNCCHWETPSVTVRNCGSFYIYHLAPAPDCIAAYCLQRQI